ncbi:MAG: NAD(P)-binding protein [Bdellovibrionaceae bacterium]|nr:NAD(P)-binding protein [Pseudobdellovibrionaceae bacterium]
MKTDRREFLKYGLLTSSAFLGSIYTFHQRRSRSTEELNYTGELIDQSERGHQLRKAMAMEPRGYEEVPVLIAGGGMSGLLTGYYLKTHGFNNFRIVEMNDRIGGNSSYGENAVSKYPWGAHYIPLPNMENVELVTFLKDMGVAKAGGKNVEFSEEYLCQDPQERLFMRGEWQESILPSKNITREDQDQLKRFHDLVEAYKYKKGRDGRFVFSIPVMLSSQDPEHLALDRISFDQFLKKNNFNSDVVHWYMNYCMLDDYGMGTDLVSAWAGLHYFCSRRPLGQYDDHRILTWPEGNGWVLQRLEEILKNHIASNQAVIDIHWQGPKRVASRIFDFQSRQMTACQSHALIFSAPQFLSQYLFKQKTDLPEVDADDYYSWVVANVTLKLPANELNKLHWDNVRFGSKSLGYVHARHQELRARTDGTTVLTLYWPLYEKNHTATEIRKKISGMSWQQWAQQVVSEFEFMHPGISKHIRNVDVKVHGHAMMGPRIGRMQKVFTTRSRYQNKKGIFFSHTDNSGMSLFEEAHFWGHQTAREVLKYVGIS